MGKKFYLTTAIAYTSSKPHIGNVYEAILADGVAAFKGIRAIQTRSISLKCLKNRLQR